MRRNGFIAALTALSLAACASSLPVRDFRSDYDRAERRSVKVDGYPPFNVLELKERRRLKVALNILAQAFGGLGDPLVLMGLSDGIPPMAAHRAAARAYLAETRRPSCTVEAAAISSSGREYEFQYACSAS
jgi:hypothetical protein